MFAGLFSLLSYRPRIPHARAAVTLSELDTPTLTHYQGTCLVFLSLSLSLFIVRVVITLPSQNYL